MERVEENQALCEILTQASKIMQAYSDACINVRFGQALFNAAYDKRPELVGKVVGTDLDPYNCEAENDPKISAFCEWLVENW